MGLGSSVGHGGGWVGGCVEGKMETTILEQQFKKYKIMDLSKKTKIKFITLKKVLKSLYLIFFC